MEDGTNNICLQRSSRIRFCRGSTDLPQSLILPQRLPFIQEHAPSRTYILSGVSHNMFGVRRTASLWKTTNNTIKYSTTAKTPKTVPTLPDSTLATFRSRAFQPETPALLTRGQFTSLPAAQKWFSRSAEHPHETTSLNTAYLSNFGNAIVPLEITDNGQFTQTDQPLQFFLEYVSADFKPDPHFKKKKENPPTRCVN